MIAKYGNTQYVLYYVPDLGGNTIPLTSEPMWVKDSGAGFTLSNFIGYTGTPYVPVPVPDGGATLMLLGAALGCLEVVRRFKKI